MTRGCTAVPTPLPAWRPEGPWLGRRSMPRSERQRPLARDVSTVIVDVGGLAHASEDFDVARREPSAREFHAPDPLGGDRSAFAAVDAEVAQRGSVEVRERLADCPFTPGLRPCAQSLQDPRDHRRGGFAFPARSGWRGCFICNESQAQGGFDRFKFHDGRSEGSSPRGGQALRSCRVVCHGVIGFCILEASRTTRRPGATGGMRDDACLARRTADAVDS